MDKFHGMAMLVTSSGRPVNIEWAVSLPAFVYPMGMSVGWFLCKGKGRGEQRDALLQKAVDLGAEYAFMIDDDVICPNYTIQQLHYQLAQRPDVGVIGGIYTTKSINPEPLVFQDLGGGPFWGWTLRDVFECKGIATGCMMIKTSILKDIPKPWFVDYQIAPIGMTKEINGEVFPLAGTAGTDDLYFCQKVTEAGYKILAHGGILPIHVSEDKFFTLPLDSYPCTSFDARQVDLRAQAEAAAKMLTKNASSYYPAQQDRGTFGGPQC